MLEFEPLAESFSVYVKQVNLFFTANEMPEDKRVPVFLTIVGKSTYALLRSLLQSSLPKDKKFEAITEILKKHCQPALSVIAEWFQFHKRTQKEEESVAEYVAKLKRLSTHCQFEAYLDDALRDCLVCRLRKELTQKRLLLEDQLTFTKAVEMAQNIESIDKQTLAIKNAATVPSGLNNQISSLSTTCYWCGKLNHTASQCCYKDVDCLKCGKRGHLKAVCHSKGPIGGQPPVSSLHLSEMSKWSEHSSRSQRTKYIEEIEDKSGNQSSSPNQDLARS